MVGKDCTYYLYLPFLLKETIQLFKKKLFISRQIIFIKKTFLPISVLNVGKLYPDIRITTSCKLEEKDPPQSEKYSLFLMGSSLRLIKRSITVHPSATWFYYLKTGRTQEKPCTIFENMLTI